MRTLKVLFATGLEKQKQTLQMQKCNQNGLESRFSREESSADPAKAVELTEAEQGSVAVGLVGLEKQEAPQKEQQTAHRAEQSNRSRISRKIGDFK